MDPKNKYKFYKGLDYPGYDLKYVGGNSLELLMKLAEEENTCIGFNTLGFLKCRIDVNKLVKPNCYHHDTDGLYVNEERYTHGNLYILGDKYRLDKSITYGHNYIPTYDKFFSTRRNSTQKVLEIGIGCLEEGQMIHMARHNYITGNSLRMWREYFPHALICGIDIYEKAMLLNEDRIITLVADQSDEKCLLKIIDKIGSGIDIIIDDGSHQLKHQIFTFMFMEKYLNKHGIYVIEDISSQHLTGFKDLSFFPDEFRSYLNATYNITCVDSRGSHNNYNDIMCIFERKCPIIYIKGVSGLTNNIFQVFAAIQYAEKYNARIILDKKSELLHYGTSNKFGRDTGRRINGSRQSYLDTIFKKLDTTYEIPEIANVIYNDCFSTNVYEELDKPNLSNENLDVKILIDGYCQNIELFYEYRNKLFNYLNLDDDCIIKYIQEKYPMNPLMKNIMLGIRIGQDFKGMKKITKKSYTNALEILTSDENYHIYVISDVMSGWECMIDEKYLSKVTLVNEDDIVQIYVGMCCNNFISSESTYHYMIALLAYIKDQTKLVVVFNDTDITNRRLSHLLTDWIRIDY